MLREFAAPDPRTRASPRLAAAILAAARSRVAASRARCAAARAAPLRAAAAAGAGAPRPTPRRDRPRQPPRRRDRRTTRAQRKPVTRVSRPSTASCTPRACRSPPSRRASARRATSIRAPRSRRAYRAIRPRRSPAPPHLVCYAMKANSNLAVLEPARAPGQRLRHRLRRRARARARRRRRSRQGRVLRRRQDRGRDGGGARGRHPLLQRRVGRRARRARTRSPAALGMRGAGVVPGQSRRRSAAPIPYISTGLKESKFGIAFDEAPALYRRAATLPHVAVRGIDCHIGSQITDLARVRRGRRARCSSLVDRIAARRHRARARRPRRRPRHPLPRRGDRSTAGGLRARGARASSAAGRQRLLFEPGAVPGRQRRRRCSPASLYLKPGGERNFAIVDAAMNDLIRPALYDAWHDVDAGAPARRRARAAGRSSGRSARAAISSPATASSRSRRATCSRCAAPAPTASR